MEIKHSAKTTVSSPQAPENTIQATKGLSASSVRIWRFVQVAVWLIGIAILAALLLYPTIGIHAFWNVLIPIAPALLAIAPGLWRNVCPLGSTALFPRHLGFSRQIQLSNIWQGWLGLIGVSLLLLIVPLRHVILNTNGLATAITIICLAAVAVCVGLLFEWKSGWCSGLCPVHPVEKLYGFKPVLNIPNAHCDLCRQCVAPCPDSMRNIQSNYIKKSNLHMVSSYLIVGGFPGFIWGWFHVRDYFGNDGWQHLLSVYAWPFAGFAVTLILYVVLKQLLPSSRDILLNAIFAAAAISCYYWFRVPALVGFGPFPGDGMLVDLSKVLPTWTPVAFQIITTSFFVWWLILRNKVARTWLVRPPYFKPAL